MKWAFDSQTFQMTANKSAPVLSYFEWENCMQCHQDLIRFGENLYVLHSTITCIAPKLTRKKKKKKSQEERSQESETTVENTEIKALCAE